MHWLITFFSCLVVCLFISTAQVQAQAPQQAAPPAPKEEVLKAQVTNIIEEGEREVAGKKHPYQRVQLRILDGTDRNKEITVNHGEQINLLPRQKVAVGEKIVLLKMMSPERTSYQIVDKYRLDILWYILGVFFLLVVGLNRWKGLGSIVGLALSLAVIMGFIVPQILAGRDPFTIIILGSIFILITTMYLSHGFYKSTHIALVATIAALLCSGLLAVFFVEIAKLTGLGSEDAYALQFIETVDINFQGMLLGGIIIGALGVLDDVTTSLSAAISELKKANPKYTYNELVKSGLNIGAEHTSSLVNTLFLAYASAGLPVLLFIILNPTNQPLWAIINSEIVAEEIVRTLAGSIGLVLAIPITTFIAAWAVSEKFSVDVTIIHEKPKVKKFLTKGKK